jgi:hypothetical protein
MRSNQEGGGACENDLADVMGERRCCFLFLFKKLRQAVVVSTRRALKRVLIGLLRENPTSRRSRFPYLHLPLFQQHAIQYHQQRITDEPHAFPPSIMLTLVQYSSPAPCTPLHYSILQLNISAAYAEARYHMVSQRHSQSSILVSRILLI